MFSRSGWRRWIVQDLRAGSGGRSRGILRAYHIFLFALCIFGAGVRNTCWGATGTWTVGRGGLSWSSQSAVSVGVMFDGQSLRPRDISAEKNLFLDLEWVSGRPEDYTLGGMAHVWDNSPFEASNLILVDGRDTTSTEDRFQKDVSQAGRAFFFDLGASYPIKRIVFYPHPDEGDYFIKAFEIWTNDGQTFNDIGLPVYELLKRVEDNPDVHVDLSFPVHLVRFIQLRTLSRDSFNLAEVEVYGEGSVPRAGYISELHRFEEGPVNFGDLVLTTQRRGPTPHRPGEALAVLQVRSGADDTPLMYYRRDPETRIEEEVSEQEYNKLSVLERGSIREDGEHWSPWSPPVRIDSTGRVVIPLDLPSPREYFQFRIEFEGTDVDVMQIDELSVAYSTPLVDVAVGEIALLGVPDPPERVVIVPVGMDTSFTLNIRTDFGGSDLEGFDGIRITSPSTPRFLRLERGDPLVEEEPDSLRADSSGFTIYFSRITEDYTLRVTFKTMLLSYTSTINAWLLSSGEGLPQPVLAGDANKQVNTNALHVFGAEMKPSVSMSLSSPVITPNGDGRNDELRIFYDILQFVGAVQVELAVYDLSGVRVNTLLSTGVPPGRYEWVWDGTDDGGVSIVPGVYLCRMSVEADARTFSTLQRIVVAY